MGVLKFELKRILRKQNLKIILGVFLLLCALIYDGMHKFNSIMKDKTEFQKSEKEKVMSYGRYSQYGGYGIRLIFIPTNFFIISSDAFNIPVSNINTGERLTIFKSLKGKNYRDRQGFMDFCGFILLLGSLSGLIIGYKTSNRQEYLKFIASFSSPIKSIFVSSIIRLILLNFIFLFVISVSFLFPLIKGINLFNIYFILTFILTLSFFFSLGVIVGHSKRSKRSIILALSYLCFVLLVPWMIDKFDEIQISDIKSVYNFEQEAQKLLMNVERQLTKRFGTFKSGKYTLPAEIRREVRAALNKEFKEIFDAENRRKETILGKIKVYQLLSALSPVSFYQSVESEMRGGELSFIDFYSFALKKKYEFIEFYFIKRFCEPQKPGKVESFIKGNENLYYAKNWLPYGFVLGVGVTILHIIGAFFIAFMLYHKRIKRKIKGIDIDVDFKEKSTVFVLCKNETIKEGIFNHYKNQDTTCLEKINPDDFRMNGIKPADLLEHLSRVARVDDKTAVENLNIMGVDIDTAENSHETILKIYAAVMAVADRQLIVINDFLKRESRQFETEVFRLLSHLEKAGKRIIYLSTEMYQPANGFDEQIRIDKYGVFPIELDGLTLR